MFENTMDMILVNLMLHLLTCFPGNNINGAAGGSVACTIEGRHIHMVASVRLQVFQFGGILLTAHLYPLCSCFFIMSSPVTNL